MGLISELGVRAHRVQKSTLMGELKEYADKETDLIVLSTAIFGIRVTSESIKMHHKEW